MGVRSQQSIRIIAIKKKKNDAQEITQVHPNIRATSCKEISLRFQFSAAQHVTMIRNEKNIYIPKTGPKPKLIINLLISH